MSKIYVDEIAGIASADTVAIPGHVIQVVNGQTSSQTSSVSSTFSDTTLTATITPTSATSKILVLVNQCGCGKAGSNTTLQLRLLRDATPVINIEQQAGSTGSTANNAIGSISSSYLDSPATTSAITYKTQFASQSNTSQVLVQWTSVATSTITLMEIAG